MLEFLATPLGQLLIALGAGGGMTVGIIGLAMGGSLPGIRVPDHLRGIMKLVWAVTVIITLTLVTDADPDLLEKALNQLAE